MCQVFKHRARACRGICHGAGCRKETRQLQNRCRLVRLQVARKTWAQEFLGVSFCICKNDMPPLGLLCSAAALTSICSR